MSAGGVCPHSAPDAFAQCVSDSLTSIAQGFWANARSDYERGAIGSAVGVMHSAICSAACRPWGPGQEAVESAAQSIHAVGNSIGLAFHDAAQKFRDLGYDVLRADRQAKAAVCARFCTVEL